MAHNETETFYAQQGVKYMAAIGLLWQEDCVQREVERGSITPDDLGLTQHAIDCCVAHATRAEES